MSRDELTETHRAVLARGQACVVIAARDADEPTRRCLESILAHTPPDVHVAIAAASDQAAEALRPVLDELSAGKHPVRLLSADSQTTGAQTGPQVAQVPQGSGDHLTIVVRRAVELLQPADVALVSEPCLVCPGWLAALRDAAHGDSTTATASALATHGTTLALNEQDESTVDLDKLASNVAKHTMKLRPRLELAVGPCVYLRRDALELVGPFKDELDLNLALQIDFAQRCLLSGLSHVAADDVMVAPLGEPRALEERLTAQLHETYPYLSEPPTTAASSALPRSLEAARRGGARLSVTVDVRALDGAITGTQRHILELVKALAESETLRLRLLVRPGTSAAIIELLSSLPDTELLPIEAIDGATPPSTIFHRPQQVFEPNDMQLALRLGKRIVLSQLDLIAYRNPGYHANVLAWDSHRRVTQQALAAADRIVVSSEHTRSELLSDGLVDDNRVRIVPPGLDHMTTVGGRPATNGEPPLTLPELAGFSAVQPGHKDGFLLCLGTDFRHKNRLFALRLLVALRERHGWQGGLVLAGTHIPHGSSRELEQSFLERHPELRAAVRDVGPIDDPDRDWLMRNASAVAYPSVYEGFGLIPFESALSGVPCAFAPQSSLADVLPREAASIVPWNPEESADRLFPLLSDRAACARHLQLITDAAARHTWSGSAAAMVGVYHEAAVAPAREAATLSRDELEREHKLRKLIADHDALVAKLVFEREHTQRMYDELNAEVGFGLSLIGPKGALPEDVQRALVALSARPRLSRLLYGAASRTFRLMRTAGRMGRHRYTERE